MTKGQDMLLAPGVTVARRTADSVQIGLDATRRVIARALSPRAVEALLAAQYTRHWPQDTNVIPEPVTREAQMFELILEPAPPPSNVLPPAPWTTEFSGICSVTLLMLEDLARMNSGDLVLIDDTLVSSEDVYAQGFLPSHVGMTRAAAARDWLLERYPQALVRHAPSAAGGAGQPEPDLIVCAASRAVDPVEARALMSDLIPHLFIMHTDTALEIGPFVYPGHSACMNCVQLHEVDDDPQWLTLIAHVLNHPRPVRGHLPLYIERTAAGIAVSQIMTAQAQRRPYTAWSPQDRFGSSIISVSDPGGLPRIRYVAAHPSCGCFTLPD